MEMNELISKYKAEMEKYRKFEPSKNKEFVLDESTKNATPPPIIDEEFYKTISDFPVREYEERDTDRAGLKVYAYTGRQSLPVVNANVTVTRVLDGREVLHLFTRTNISGETEVFYLPAPDRELSQKSENKNPFAEYNVRVDAKGYYTVENLNVPLFGGETSFQPVEMIPVPENEKTIREKIVFENENPDL